MNWITTKGEQFLEKHTEIGDSIGHVKTLQEDFDNFENKAKVIHRLAVVNFKCTLFNYMETPRRLASRNVDNNGSHP